MDVDVVVDVVVAKELSGWVDFWLGGYFSVSGPFRGDGGLVGLQVLDPDDGGWGRVFASVVVGGGVVRVRLPWSGESVRGAAGGSWRVGCGEGVFELACPGCFDGVCGFLFDGAVGYAGFMVGVASRGSGRGRVRFYRDMGGVIEKYFRGAWLAGRRQTDEL